MEGVSEYCTFSVLEWKLEGFLSTLTCSRTSSESKGPNRGLAVIQPLKSSSMHSISRDNWSMPPLGSSNPVEPKVCTMWGWESTSTMSASARKCSRSLNFFMAKTPWEMITFQTSPVAPPLILCSDWLHDLGSETSGNLTSACHYEGNIWGRRWRNLFWTYSKWILLALPPSILVA